MNNLEKLSKVLNNTKIVCFDFDDTLCIHPACTQNCFNADSHSVYCKAVLTGDEKFYSVTQPKLASKVLNEFIKLCTEKGIMQKVLTWGHYITIPSIRARLNFLKENYDCVFEEKDIIYSGTRERKLAVLKDLAGIYCLGKYQILLVEDHPQTLEDVRVEGFNAISVSELYALYGK